METSALYDAQCVLALKLELVQRFVFSEFYWQMIFLVTVVLRKHIIYRYYENCVETARCQS